MACNFCTDFDTLLTDNNATLDYTTFSDDTYGTIEESDGGYLLKIKEDLEETLQTFVVAHLLTVIPPPDDTVTIFEPLTVTSSDFDVLNTEISELKGKALDILIPGDKLKEVVYDRKTLDSLVLADIFRTSETIIMQQVNRLDLKV